MFAVCPEAGTSARVVVAALPERIASFAYDVDDAPIVTKSVVVACVTLPILFVVHPPAVEFPVTEIGPQKTSPPLVCSALLPEHAEILLSVSVLENRPVPVTSRFLSGAVLAIPTFPAKYALPVVVAPPEMVSPSACVPDPTVDEASDRKPDENVCSRVVVAVPFMVSPVEPSPIVEEARAMSPPFHAVSVVVDCP